MNNDASFHDAKRLYLEQYGDPMVTNTYLKIALASACPSFAWLWRSSTSGPFAPSRISAHW